CHGRSSAKSCQGAHLSSRLSLRDLLQRGPLVLAGGALTIIIITGWAAFELSLANALANASGQANRRLALFDRTLEAIIERFHYLPSSLTLAAEVGAILADPGNAEL